MHTKKNPTDAEDETPEAQKATQEAADATQKAADAGSEPEDAHDDSEAADGDSAEDAEDATGNEDDADSQLTDNDDQVDSSDSGNGFPANTPVSKMTLAEQVAYWRHHSRRHEGTARTLQAQLDAASPEPDALEAAREEGRKEARLDAGRKALTATTLAGLTARGKDDNEADAIAKSIDLDRFITDDGDIDEAGLTSLLDTLAGPAKGHTRHRWPAMGQGNTGTGAPTNGVAAGRAMHAAEKAKRTGRKV